MIDISSLAEKFVEKNKNPNKSPKKSSLSRNNFKFLYVIGKGGFGRVWKIQSKKTKTEYALKEMSKLKIIDKKSEKSINSEREFLSKLNHPFIVNMHYAFQDSDNLYLVMDILNGGDLRYHVSRYRKFSEEQTRFFIANMVFALQYIHDNNVIHRDIKPENLVLDDKGYVRITDFGIAKENMPDNSSETSGTPGYMAPEVMKSKNHSFPVDFFAIGVIGYEFMLGKRPYYGKSRKEIKEQMMSRAAVINEDSVAHGWSQESVDFINRLLERKESKRLGYKEGARELMNHLWLKYYPWEELKNKTLLAPFIPDPKDNFDKHYCESVEKISEETKMRYEDIYCSSNFKKMFVDFYFNEDEIATKRERELQELKEKEKELKEKKENELKEAKKIINEKKKEKIVLDSNKDIVQNSTPHSNKNTNNSNIKKNKELNNINPISQTKKNSNNNSNNINSNVIKNIRVNKINNNNNINNNTNPHPENSQIASINSTSKKSNEPNFLHFSKNINNTNNKKSYIFKKPLVHSNSTKEIYSTNNLEKYIRMRQNQIEMQRMGINKNPGNISKKKYFGGTKFNKIPSSSKGGTSININNYYTNNIFSAIYNNFIPHQLYEKKNEVERYKKSQRSSSVFTQKRPGSKNYLEKNKKFDRGAGGLNSKYFNKK